MIGALRDFFARQPRVLEWGVVRPEAALPHSDRLEAWVAQGLHGGLRYMEERLPERRSPARLFPWAKSVVLFSLRQPAAFGSDTGDFRLAAYALGEDYHRVARRILSDAEKHLQPRRFAGFCDTWPVFERDLAAEAGLGWRGKNACLIHKRHGSGFLLAGFFLDVELGLPPTPQMDFCGGCTACLDACPTEALLGPGKLDASKCISYWTVEAKGSVPEGIAEKTEGWIFGCDICQEVCPWNHKHKKGTESGVPHEWPRQIREWLTLLRKGGGFQSRFRDTPLSRAGRKAMLRNVLMALRRRPAENLDDLLDAFSSEENDPVVLEELRKVRGL